MRKNAIVKNKKLKKVKSTIINIFKAFNILFIRHDNKKVINKNSNNLNLSINLFNRFIILFYY